MHEQEGQVFFMADAAFFQAGTARGFRADTAAGTLSGVVEGIAFRATAEPCTLEMSVNIPEAHLSKLQARIAAIAPFCAGAVTAHHHFGVLVTLPAAPTTGEDWVRFIEAAAKEATKLIGVAYDDKFEKDTEPFTAYLRGILGAFLGALVGVLPWFLTQQLLNWQMWYFGVLVGIGSFYGYCRFRGAHNTQFAMAMVVVFSLFAVLFAEFFSTVLAYWSINDFDSILQAARFCLQGAVLQTVIRSSLFGLIACGLGLAGIRSRILAYTHDSQYLRRGPKRKR